MSKIIVIEGPDRVGKATQSLMLKNRLEAAGYTATIVEVPIRSNFAYHVVYWMLRNGLAKRFPKIFQWFQFFNRQVFQWRQLPKLEAQYDYIVMDRWSLSTIVYGEATGVPKDYTESLSKKLRKPFLTIVLLGAAHRHKVEDVYEADGELQRRVRRLYSEWARNNPNDCFVFDSLKDRAVISNEVWNALRSFEKAD